MLTVITPVVNGEVYIRACLDNVIAQGVEQIEHIVADGGSTDNTIPIVEEYRSKHSHIRLLRGPDKGQSDAMNKATELAKGQIIGILNVDDAYEPEALKAVIAAFSNRQGPAIGVGDCRVYDAAGQLLYVNQPRFIGFWAYLLGFPYPVNPVAYFYHRELHDLVGGYDISDHYAMDLDFLCAAGLVGEHFRIPKVLGDFRMTSGSKTVTDRNINKGGDRVKKILNRYADKYPFYIRWSVGFMRVFVRFLCKACNRLSAWSGGSFEIVGCK